MLQRIALIGMFALATASGMADEVEEQIQLGLESYKNKEFKTAIDDLNYAVAQIQELLNSQNASLLPEPLPGWTASEVENASAGMAMLGGGTNMSRSYQRGPESVEINLTAGSPMISAMMAMMNNPMLLSADPNTKPYRYKRIKGMKKTMGTTLEITLGLAGQIMVQVNASGVTDEAVITQYLDAMDFERIQRAFLQ